MPTATAPLCGLLHCLPCVARLKEANNHQMADPDCDTRRLVKSVIAEILKRSVRHIVVHLEFDTT